MTGFCGGFARILIPLLLAGGVLPAAPASLGRFPESVSEFTLSSGLHVIVVRRAAGPGVSLHLVARGGWADDPPGQRGLSRLLERSVREGSFTVGSADTKAERAAAAAVDATLEAFEAEAAKGEQGDQLRLQRLRSEVNQASERMESLSQPEALAAALSLPGGARFQTVLLADTFSVTATLPPADAERWFSELAAWIRDPSFRRFYRHRIDLSAAAGRGTANPSAGLLSAAFGNAGYGLPDAVAAEVATLRISDARTTMERRFAARNLVIVAVGDVDAGVVRGWAQRHWETLPAGEKFQADPSVAPGAGQVPGPSFPSLSPAVSTPTVAIGYRRPGIHHTDDPALDLIREHLVNRFAEGLHSGRRLLALPAATDIRAALPGNERASVFSITAQPLHGAQLDEVEKVLQAEVAALVSEPISAAAIREAQNRFYWLALRQLDDNAMAATMVALNQAAYGKWSRLDGVLAEILELTPEKLQAVAARHLVPANLVVWRSDRTLKQTQPTAVPATEESKP